MKKILFAILYLSLLHTTMEACSSCITQTSEKGKHIATRQMHSIKKADCTCQCTGKRSVSGKCLECDHQVANHSFFSFSTSEFDKGGLLKGRIGD